MDTETDSLGVIYVINKFKVKNKSQPFRCIMIYQDQATRFCFIRPLLYKIDLEIVMELFKIFTSYAAPKVVHVNSCTLEMVKNIDNNMKALCPMFKIEFIKMNGENNDIALYVVAKLHRWMEVTNKSQWEIGCCIVQREINTEIVADKDLTPQEMFFRGVKDRQKAEKTEKEDTYSKEDRDDNESDEQNLIYDDDDSGGASSAEFSVDPNALDHLDQIKEESIEIEEMDLSSKEVGNYVSTQEAVATSNDDDVEIVVIKQEIDDEET